MPTETAQPTEPAVPTVSVPEPTEPEIRSHEAIVTRFLTEVNHDGEYLPGEDGEINPGDLADPARIPQPDQSLMGQICPRHRYSRMFIISPPPRKFYQITMV